MDIHSDISFIHSFTKYLHGTHSVSAPKLGAAGDPITPSLPETLLCWSPRDELSVLIKLGEHDFLINLSINPSKKQSLVYKSPSPQ